MKSHTYYVPTDYEQCLLAAGWLKIEDIDPDYLEYIRIAPTIADGEIMTHAQWTHMKQNWDELNERYEREVEPHLWGENSRVDKLANELLRDMSWCEVALGY